MCRHVFGTRAPMASPPPCLVQQQEAPRSDPVHPLRHAEAAGQQVSEKHGAVRLMGDLQISCIISPKTEEESDILLIFGAWCKRYGAEVRRKSRFFFSVNTSPGEKKCINLRIKKK